MTRTVDVRAREAHGTGAMIGAVLDGRLVRPVFQPIVDLSTRAVVGMEALARGPAGSVLEFPDRLFAAARDAGRFGELDMLCQRDGSGRTGGPSRGPASRPSRGPGHSCTSGSGAAGRGGVGARRAGLKDSRPAVRTNPKQISRPCRRSEAVTVRRSAARTTRSPARRRRSPTVAG
ncbi:hypothetical protein GCM10027610_027660 [Dactylosporangium cerinum]